MYRGIVASLAVACLISAPLLLSMSAQECELDGEMRRWVDGTLAQMTLEEKIGQLLVPSFYSVYTSSDSETYDELVTLIHEYRVGGFLVFGARQERPDALPNQGAARVSLGQPLNAASLINRLQAIASVPLLMAADFETGLGFRMSGGTAFPRAMAFGAAGDTRLAYEAGRITAIEARAIGVHMNLAPVVDVNNNPKNPVINTRSFGQDPEAVSTLAAAYVEGLKAEGMLATIKHFPGHGDTDVDSHRGLPLIAHPRERLDRIELPPFRAGIRAGADAVMTAHIQWPNLESSASTPATFSRRIVEGVLRAELGFDGLVVTDSMRMQAVNHVGPGDAAARAVSAGHDLVLHSPDDVAAFDGLRDAVRQGEISESRLDESVRRILSAKARLGLHRSRSINLETLPLVVGTRASRKIAREVSERSITLLRDEGDSVPLRVSQSDSVLYLSVLDHTLGWGVTEPSRMFILELQKRWPNVTAVELSDRTPASEVARVSESASQYDAVVAGVFVRATPIGGRLGLSKELVSALRGIAREAKAVGRPFITVFFGNPYTATTLGELPTMILTYDVRDLAQASAVRAIAGETAIGGRLPISLGEGFPLRHGLVREGSQSP